MVDMGAVPMRGGCAMSMAWMPLCGQTWTGAAAAFTGMWLVRMVAMMLPVLVPMMRRYRRAGGRTGEMHLGLLTMQAGARDSLLWGLAGPVVCWLGAWLAGTLMRFPAPAQCRHMDSRLWWSGRPW